MFVLFLLLLDLLDDLEFLLVYDSLLDFLLVLEVLFLVEFLLADFDLLFERLGSLDNDLDIRLDLLEVGEVLGDLLGVLLSLVALEVQVDLLFVHVD